MQAKCSTETRSGSKTCRIAGPDPPPFRPHNKRTYLHDDGSRTEPTRYRDLWRPPSEGFGFVSSPCQVADRLARKYPSPPGITPVLGCSHIPSETEPDFLFHIPRSAERRVGGGNAQELFAFMLFVWESESGQRGGRSALERVLTVCR